MFKFKTSQLNNKANWVIALILSILPCLAYGQTVTKETFGGMGIKLNTKVYTIRNYDRGWWQANGSRIQRQQNNLQDTNTSFQFVFVTPSDEDTTHVYLYSVSQKAFANVTTNTNNNQNGNLSSTSTTPIYLYRVSGNSNRINTSLNNGFNELFTFTENKSGRIVNVNNSGWWAGPYGSNNSDIDGGTLFKAVEVSSVTLTNQELKEARSLLRGWLQGPFHSKGYTGRPLKSNGMGDVAEVDYYYYVDSQFQQYGKNKGMHAVDLQLPFQRYLTRYSDGRVQNGNNQLSNGNNYEPKGYIRWYNYHTDKKAPYNRVIRWRYDDNNGDAYSNRTQLLKDVISMNGDSLGLFSYGTTTNSNAASVGVAYVIPTDSADSETWQGDTIGCDVSFYTDYDVPMDADGTCHYDAPNFTHNLQNFQHEPTLGVRYIYHILPAERIANQMRSALLTHTRGYTHTMGNKGTLSFGARDSLSTFSLRTDLQNINFYYFYPLSGSNKHVYHPLSETNYNITDSDIPVTNRPLQAQSLEYRVYTSDSTMYRVFYTGSNRLIDVSLSGTNPLNELTNSTNKWTYLDGSSVPADKKPHLTTGSICYLVAYVVNGSSKCPFFDARLEITPYHPISYEEINNGQHTARTESYLTSHFGSPIADFTFDNDNTDQNTNAPTGGLISSRATISNTTSTIQNSNTDMSTMPALFSQRQYSFLYPQLGKFRENLGYNTSYSGGDTYGSLHGDYQLYKNRGYYDITHLKDNNRYGYYMYTDASDESRALGVQDFVGNLCAGSQIIVSAWVRGENANRNDAQPELRFVLSGVTTDVNGRATSTTELASVLTGAFERNIDNYVANPGDAGHYYNINHWYQVFGIVTLPANSGVENFSNFRITIDNFCRSTNGADYSIDDIKVYQSNSKLRVIQVPAMCDDSDAGKVNISITGNYTVLRDLTGAISSEKTVRYRFYRTNGTPITGIYDNNEDYGEATVPTAYDANATFENGIKRFSTNPLTHAQEIVLVDRPFSLSPDSTYYVGVSTDEGRTWGAPNTICSIYSDNFQLVRQQPTINGSVNGVVSVNIKCGEDTTSSYRPIGMGITAPDKVNGGTITLNNVHYDWYNGTLAEYNKEKDDSGNLLATAVDHYRHDYPSGAFDSNKATKATVDTLLYTDVDKSVIEKYLYNKDSNKNGKLLMAGADSLSTLPISVGRDTLLAIPVEDHVTVDGQDYILCANPMEFVVRGISDGPSLNLGMKEITYPASTPYRYIRIGLPQIKKMGRNGVLSIPIKSRAYQDDTDPDLTFVNLQNNADTVLYISQTNDSTINVNDLASAKIANVVATVLRGSEDSLRICNINWHKLHEGYWYELELRFKDTQHFSEANSCPGETFFILKIVPEYLTWTPTADGGLNSNWNNDANWTRATAGELDDASYEDYRTPTYQFSLHDANGNVVANGRNKWNTIVDRTLRGVQPATYVPMYFSKVIIPTLGNKPYPMLGYIGRQNGTNLVQSITNGKRHAATTNIQYDMEASPSNADSTSYKSVVFDGNICEQIHFKTSGQLRNEQYLNYQKAWAELALPINAWGTFTTPMDHTIAGDMYVPKVNAMQETPLFKDMHFDDKDAVDENGLPWTDQSTGTKYGLYGKAGDGIYSRLRMPTYQKLWGENPDMFEGDNTRDTYASYDQPYLMMIFPSAENGDEYTEMHDNDNVGSLNVWSHTFNAVGYEPQKGNQQLDGVYKDAYGVAGKIGDDYSTPSTSWSGKFALMRLPKADTSFKLYYIDQSGALQTTSATYDVSKQRENNYRLGVAYTNTDGDIGLVKLGTAPLAPEPYGYATDNAGNFKYDAGGNIMFIDKNGNETETPTGLVYDLIGNPYTSTITVSSFVEANKSVLRTVKRDGQYVYRVWMLNGNNLLELDPNNSKAVIDPGRAFFVPVQVVGRDTVMFTTNMQTDPNVSLTNNAKANGINLEDAAAKIYRITDKTDVTNIIEHGIDTQVYCWTPYAGVIAVSGESIRKVEIFSVNGQLVQSAEMSGNEKQFSVGSGIYIVKATLKDGKVESRKVAVK